MTAQECLSHEWLSDLFAKQNSDGSLSSQKLPNPSASNNVTQLCDENAVDCDYVQNSYTDNVWTTDSKGKIVDQQSEMSLDEPVSDTFCVNSKDVNETVDDLGNKQQTNMDNSENSNSGVEVTVIDQDENLPTDDTETGASESVSDFVQTSSTPDTAVHSGAEDITPDTDSSMCISEAKAHDTDSGMVTGSESKSGRESVELDLLNEEGNVFEEPKEEQDTEMFGKSVTVERDSELVIVTQHEEKVEGIDSDKQGMAKEDSSVVNTSEESENMDTEQSNTVLESSTQESEQNKSTNTLKTIAEHSSLSVIDKEGVFSNQMLNTSTATSGDDDIALCARNRDQNLNHSSHSDIHMQSAGEGRGMSSSAPIKKSLTSGGRPSVGGIDDSINSMQLGERLKRGMCNESSTTGNAENNDEEEYEFISVSKRVRSIEESFNTSGSPPFSPKIARSPRVPRHSRHHQHH